MCNLLMKIYADANNAGAIHRIALIYCESPVMTLAEQHCDVDTPIFVSRGKVQIIGAVKQIGIENYRAVLPIGYSSHCTVCLGEEFFHCGAIRIVFAKGPIGRRGRLVKH